MSNCCPKPVGLAAVAENPWFIVFAYVAAFLPWGWLYGLDYISDVWKTMQKTRLSGYWHLLLSAPSLAYIIAYAHVQRVAGDFKEMMTAVVAIIMCIYHISRTCWGLMQLAAFRAWCQHTMDCMYALRMNLWCKQEDEYILKPAVPHKRPTFLDIEQLTMVNNTVVDNELKVNDLIIYPAWIVSPMGNVKQRNASRWMKTKDPRLCTVRWTGAFLCAFGNPWRGGNSKAQLESIFERAKNSLWALLQTTIILCSENNRDGNRDKGNLFSILQMLVSGQRKFIASHTAYNANIPNYHLFQTFAKNSSEYNNLLNVYPASNPNELNNLDDEEDVPEESVYNENRNNLVTQLVDSVALAKHLGTETLADIQLQKESLKFPTAGTEENAWNILLEQKDEFHVQKLNFNTSAYQHEFENRQYKQLKNPVAVGNVPQFPWNRLLVMLWEKGTNRRVLQASAHEDIVLALYAGRMAQTGSCSIFDTKHDCSASSLQPRSYPVRFVGVTLETVRSFLAEWVREKSAASWMPPVPDGKATPIEFIASKYIADEVTYATTLWRTLGPGRFESAEYSFFISRLAWECLHHLQSKLADTYMDHENLPASKELIMLFFLAFPVLNVSCEKDNNSESPNGGTKTEEAGEAVSLKIEIADAVQNIYIEVTINKKTRKTKMQLMNPTKANAFHWNDWVNSAMQTMKIYGETLKNQNNPIRVRPFRKIRLEDGWISVKIDDSNSNTNGSNNSDGKKELPTWKGWPLGYGDSIGDGTGDDYREREVKIWKAWPPFDVLICQYEVNQWLEACNLKWENQSDDEWWSRLDVDDKIDEIEAVLHTILSTSNVENSLPNNVSLFFDDNGQLQICETNTE